MKDSEDVLLDLKLEADPDADRELGGEVGRAIADEDIKGCRLLLQKPIVSPVHHARGPAGLVQLLCAFQPSDGTRFSFANLTIQFTHPEGIEILDLQPRKIENEHPVEFTVSKEGKLGVKAVGAGDLSLSASTKKTFAQFHCHVIGTGEGTRMARWSFTEDPDRKNGIFGDHQLNLCLLSRGNVCGQAMVSARLIQPGLKGAYDRVRNLVLGKVSEKRSNSFEFEIPEQEKQGVLSRFFKLMK